MDPAISALTFGHCLTGTWTGRGCKSKWVRFDSASQSGMSSGSVGQKATSAARFRPAICSRLWRSCLWRWAAHLTRATRAVSGLTKD